MAIKKMPIGAFVKEIEAALLRKDGYIMGAKGQNPRTGYLDLSMRNVQSSWKENGWYYTQYKGSQRVDALNWRKKCTRVWDCNGLAEGIYEMFSGVNINTRARNNYSEWCNPKGTGRIPAKYRVPGAAVFIYSASSGYITHVGYLYKPVDSAKPGGDWYVIEARGVSYGVVQTKLYSRSWNRWGLMTKYFDYEDSAFKPTEIELGYRILKDGSEGSDVKQLQTNLINLGYDCGKWGADGEFGDATEIALMQFQRDHGCDDDGEYGPITHAAMEKALAESNAPVENPKNVIIVDGNCWVRRAPNKTSERLGIAREGTKFVYGGERSDDGWHLIEYNNQNGWVSGKYSKLEG